MATILIVYPDGRYAEVMSVETIVSVEQYLNTCYDPDLEYVDGALLERNVGDWLHSLIQSNIIYALRSKYPQLKAVPELRSQTTATRYRLPDVTVLLCSPTTKYLADAAYIAIEILSEQDTMSRVMEKLVEYEAKGVRNIWLIDPRLEQMFEFGSGALTLADRLQTGDGAVTLSRAEVFQS